MEEAVPASRIDERSSVLLPFASARQWEMLAQLRGAKSRARWDAEGAGRVKADLLGAL
jgi:hypothetical protein